MKKLLILAIGAAIMELLAMNVKIMHLPTTAGRDLGIVAAILMFAALFEKPNPDERDRLITYFSSHIAFLTTATVLTGILIYQAIAGTVQLWTLAAIASLILGKIIGRLIAQRRS